MLIENVKNKQNPLVDRVYSHLSKSYWVGGFLWHRQCRSSKPLANSKNGPIKFLRLSWLARWWRRWRRWGDSLYASLEFITWNTVLSNWITALSVVSLFLRSVLFMFRLVYLLWSHPLPNTHTHTHTHTLIFRQDYNATPCFGIDAADMANWCGRRRSWGEAEGRGKRLYERLECDVLWK